MSPVLCGKRSSFEDFTTPIPVSKRICCRSSFNSQLIERGLGTPDPNSQLDTQAETGVNGESMDVRAGGEALQSLHQEIATLKDQKQEFLQHERKKDHDNTILNRCVDVVVKSPILCGKRSFFEDFTTTIPVLKLICCRSSVNSQLIQRGLGDVMDSATRSFNELCLESTDVSDACKLNGASDPNSQPDTQEETVVNGESIDVRASAEALQSLQREIATLKDEKQELLHDNTILKGLAAKQHKKLLDYEHEISQFKEQLRILKMENIRLKQDQPNSFIYYRLDRDVY